MSDENQKHFSWLDGLPTAPEVEALLRQWPDLKVGDTVPYSDIAEILNITWRSHRFKTVTTAWRKRLRDQNVVVECHAGEYFYVATADQISARTYDTLKFIGKKAKDHRRKLAAVAVQKGADHAVIEHQARLMHVVERDSRKHRMNLLPSAKPNHPQLTPPRQAKK